MSEINWDLMDYEIEETDNFVTDQIEFRSRFMWRAQRYRDRMNMRLRVPFYRYEVFTEDGKYVVLAMQNVLVRKRDYGSPASSEKRPNTSEER